jgi:hypothetical protein
MRRGAPGRGSSTSPSRRWLRNRVRHLPIVCLVSRNSRATAVLLCPAAQPRITRARAAKAWAVVGRRDQRSSVSRSSSVRVSGGIGRPVHMRVPPSIGGTPSPAAGRGRPAGAPTTGPLPRRGPSHRRAAWPRGGTCMPARRAPRASGALRGSGDRPRRHGSPPGRDYALVRPGTQGVGRLDDKGRQRLLATLVDEIRVLPDRSLEIHGLLPGRAIADTDTKLLQPA